MKQKFYTVTMENGKVYGVPASIIANNYAKEYASNGEDYTENYDTMMNWFDTNDFEFADWAMNNMAWDEVQDQAILLRAKHNAPNFQDGWVNGEYRMAWDEVQDQAILLRAKHNAPNFQDGWVNGEYRYEVIETDAALATQATPYFESKRKEKRLRLMNEIEKAIEGFKIDNALLAGTGSEEVIKRNNLAIQALEEKAERDNPPKEMDGEINDEL